MSPAALHRTLTQTIDSSQVFSKTNQNYPTGRQKNETKRQLEISNRVVPNKTKIFSPDYCHLNQICLN